jgi:hypothetical protein
MEGDIVLGNKADTNQKKLSYQLKIIQRIINHFQNHLEFLTSHHLAQSLIMFKRPHRRPWFRPLVLAVASALILSLPVKAAERIFFTFAPVHVSIRTASIEKFANEGIVDANLRFYFDLLGVTAEQRVELREALKKRLDINPVQLSRFFNTSLGKDALSRIGRLVTIQGGRNGVHAIRGAMISAALDPEGLTAINFLRKLPTDMQIQGELVLEAVQATKIIVDATQEFIVRMAKLSAQEAATQTPADFAKLTIVLPYNDIAAVEDAFAERTTSVWA